MSHKVFWAEPSIRVGRHLRRFTFSREEACHDGLGHNAEAGIEHIEIPLDGSYVTRTCTGREEIDAEFRDDPRWPTHCGKCGQELGETMWQVFHARLYVTADGQYHSLGDAPVGMMWDADWLFDEHKGQDGIHLMVRTPGGQWLVDGQASNCTRPRALDGPRDHYCWVRHGDPRTGNVHVDKNGETCAAGAGSIICNDYHGFLHHGVLT